MSEPYLGEIRIFPWDWPPVGWAACDGSLMSLWQYQSLFAIIGNTYGGDGQTNFKLPDLRGKAPMHWGTSTVPGISAYTFNETGGQTSVPLSTATMPNHNHNMVGISALGTSEAPANNLYFGGLNVSGAQSWWAYKAPAAGLSTVPMSGFMVTTVGVNNATHNNQQPLLPLNFCIAITGTWPLHNQ